MHHPILLILQRFRNAVVADQPGIQVLPFSSMPPATASQTTKRVPVTM